MTNQLAQLDGEFDILDHAVDIHDLTNFSEVVAVTAADHGLMNLPGFIHGGGIIFLSLFHNGDNSLKNLDRLKPVACKGPKPREGLPDAGLCRDIQRCLRDLGDLG